MSQSSVGQGVGIGCGLVVGILLACVGLPLAGLILLGVGAYFGSQATARATPRETLPVPNRPEPPPR